MYTGPERRESAGDARIDRIEAQIAALPTGATTAQGGLA